MASAAGNGLHRASLRHYCCLARRVINQAERRVLWNEVSPAGEKVVSIFEDHTDIIIKDRLETYYGHKVCMTSEIGVVHRLCDRGRQSCRQRPSQGDDRAASAVLWPASAAGGLRWGGCFEGQPRGTESRRRPGLMFNKKRGLKVVDMVRSCYVYKKLRDWRAGMKGMISFLKRCFGAGRCTWKGHASFKSYVWGSVVSAKLLILARHTME